MKSKNDRYNILTDSLKRILDEVDEYIHSPQNIDKELKFHSSKLVKYGLLAKYRRLVLAIAILDINGLYDEAYILVRGLFEIAITLLYCNMDKKLYERYEMSGIIDTKANIKYCIDESLIELPNVLIDDSEKKYNEYIQKYGKCKKWNGITFRGTMEKVAEYYDDNDIKWLYLSTYKMKCSNVHSDFNSLINSFIKRDEEIVISCTINKDDSNTNIINNVEMVSQKLKYVDFKWGEGLY